MWKRGFFLFSWRYFWRNLISIWGDLSLQQCVGSFWLCISLSQHHSWPESAASITFSQQMYEITAKGGIDRVRQETDSYYLMRAHLLAVKQIKSRGTDKVTWTWTFASFPVKKRSLWSLEAWTILLLHSLREDFLKTSERPLSSIRVVSQFDSFKIPISAF